MEYSRHAGNRLDHGLYSLAGVRPDRMRQPLDPLFIAGIYAVFGRDNFAVYAIQTLVGCASNCADGRAGPACWDCLLTAAGGAGLMVALPLEGGPLACAQSRSPSGS